MVGKNKINQDIKLTHLFYYVQEPSVPRRCHRLIKTIQFVLFGQKCGHLLDIFHKVINIPSLKY